MDCEIIYVESELTVHAIVRLFEVELSKVMSLGIPICEPVIMHYTNYFTELLIKFKFILLLQTTPASS